MGHILVSTLYIVNVILGDKASSVTETEVTFGVRDEY